MSESQSKLGISGRIARQFLTSQITPLLALVGVLMGLFAVMVTPREEEPQINVTFANVFIAYPGATAKEVEDLVSTPAEQVLSEIAGIKHVYSVSQPGMSVLTVQYKVGEDRTDAIVRLYNKIYSNQDWLSSGLGVMQPIIRPMGIDDVPIVALTLWTEDETRGAYDLLKVAHGLEIELKRIKGTRDIYTIGGPETVVKVQLDPQRMGAYGIDINSLQNALSAGNSSLDAGSVVSGGREIQIQAGEFMTTPDQIGSLVVGANNGAPVYLADVAEVSLGPDYPEQLVWYGQGLQAERHDNAAPVPGKHPAVTIAVAKKPGTNAVDIANALIERVGELQDTLIPEGVNVAVTRNYGETADAKAKKLIGKLAFATGIVVLLVVFALGIKEAFIVGAAVIITLAMTLFASWAWGFTLNRVSLFALIFSIGILVDDAIVVVENIHRHIHMGARNLIEAIPRAVDEVGGPTILATFTVIAALLPMAFVTGLMGPYMSPIPINASMGMLISLMVAFVVTPWMTNAVLGRQFAAQAAHGADFDETAKGRLYGFFNRLMTPFLRGKQGRWPRVLLLGGISLLIVASVSLAVVQLVVLKMLPFDNKSEIQVIVDMPEGTTLERTGATLDALADYIATVPEVLDYQIYNGTAAPINFNGLVRQYYLRESSNAGDIQVNLVDKHDRDKQSHDIALAMRGPLQEIGAGFDANVKVVEVPPGPPVMSPLVVEVYGPEYDGQITLARELTEVLRNTPDIIDVDNTVEADVERLVMVVDRQRASLLGISQASVAQALSAAVGGLDIGFLHGPNIKYEVPVRAEFSNADKADLNAILAYRVKSASGEMVALSEVVSVREAPLEKTIYHKDLLPVVFVTGDMAGELDSPLYGMFEVFFGLNDKDPDDAVAQKVSHQYLIDQPQNPYNYSIKWDGEWQITYETFRDMGIAYGVGMILIYLLVVAQFGSYLVPLIIMAPIPLTIIGVMPGHALAGAPFTATSMIGMIALAGIIVRNSILLVDFINHQVRYQNTPFQDAVINAAAVRTKPIVLTALAAMLGAVFILDDPIFSGLAISLISGIFVSTLLTLMVIPVLYYAFMRKRFEIPA
ncbi:efflux RND transporter permease subunit [Granulosicoccaceae sp. 1_MG-2023]|nr:efflux RND transporter permease subunit [Granulosicoccaceae sp. 1_MG-2023]